MKRGEVHFRNRYKQVVQFDGLVLNNHKGKPVITATDIDFVIEISNKAWIVGELKTAGTDFFSNSNIGQRLVLERDYVDKRKAGKLVCMFIAEHNIPPEEDVHIANCEVVYAAVPDTKSRNGVSWRDVGNMTVKEHVHAFLTHYGMSDRIPTQEGRTT